MNKRTYKYNGITYKRDFKDVKKFKDISMLTVKLLTKSFIKWRKKNART